MNTRTALAILLLVLALVCFAGAAQAQEPDATPIVTVNGDPTILDDLPAPSLDIDIVMPPEPVAPVSPAELPSDVIMILIISVSTIIIVGMVLYARHQGITPQAAFQRLPGVLTEYGYPAAWNYRYGVARTTPSPADDAWLKQEASFLGYRVTDRPDGSVLLERDPAYVPPPPTG